METDKTPDLTARAREIAEGLTPAQQDLLADLVRWSGRLGVLADPAADIVAQGLADSHGPAITTPWRTLIEATDLGRAVARVLESEVGRG